MYLCFHYLIATETLLSNRRSKILFQNGNTHSCIIRCFQKKIKTTEFFYEKTKFNTMICENVLITYGT
jgi:hypothetical protein